MRWAMILCGILSVATAFGQGPMLVDAPTRDGWLVLWDGTEFGWSTKGGITTENRKTHFEAGAEAKFNIPLPVDFSFVAESDAAGLEYEPNLKDLVANDGKRKTLQFRVFAKNAVNVSSMRYRPEKLTPLFNGKDLDGWTVFPGKKSKFEAKDGEIQLTDGPGDLQTTAKYRNFILQLECKSNGKHLNSGVFFRCRAAEYQNGYECQIQNGFGKEKEYTVESFDPMSHKLLDKKKVMSGAIDWGTGSIYRRVPARGEVAKDHEWFTLTVLAVDNHFATWVDGIQQVDWTDNRPPSDNARNGYRSEAGHISLQGHDPTTNLSFRNLRIQELP